MRYPLLPTRKSIVRLLNAPRIDFLACLISLLCQVSKVGTYRPVFNALVHYSNGPGFDTKLSLLIIWSQAIKFQDWCYRRSVVWLIKQLYHLSVDWYCDRHWWVTRKLSFNQFIRSSLARELCFRRFRISREKRGLTSSCPHVAVWLPLDAFLWSSMLRTYMKICRKYLDLV
jgi:hypothetical protein